MRLIHTADWHIGATLRGFSREPEIRAALARLTVIVVEREADALIVAGDVLDSQNPSGDAQRLLFETLSELHRVRPGLEVVLTAGNHDAAGRLEAPQSLLSAIGVTVVGNVRRLDGEIDVRRHLVQLGTKRGRDPRANLLAVSYPTAACLPNMSAISETDGSTIAAAVAELYSTIHAGNRDRLGGAPLIVTGHLHVRGGEISEGAERQILVGGEHAVPPRIFPETARYVALGHLHKPQAIGRSSIRYAGSLIPLSSTELDYDHGVTLVDLERGDDGIEHIPLGRAVPFVRIPEKGDTPLADLGDHLARLGQRLGLEARLPIERRPFVQIRLERKGLGPSFRADVEQVCEKFPVRLVEIRLPELRHPRPDAASEPAVRLADLSPVELFKRAFEATHARRPEAVHLEAFHRAAGAG